MKQTKCKHNRISMDSGTEISTDSGFKNLGDGGIYCRDCGKKYENQIQSR